MYQRASRETRRYDLVLGISDIMHTPGGRGGMGVPGHMPLETLVTDKTFFKAKKSRRKGRLEIGVIRKCNDISRLVYVFSYVR